MILPLLVSILTPDNSVTRLLGFKTLLQYKKFVTIPLDGNDYVFSPWFYFMIRALL